MSLRVVKCTTLDFLRVTEVERAAWSDDPFTQILFPGPFPEGMGEFRAQEMAKQMEEDPTTRWLKVVDSEATDPNEGIAFAKWHIYADQLPGPRQTRSFGDGCNIEACELVFGGLAKQRDRLVGDKKLVCRSNLKVSLH